MGYGRIQGLSYDISPVSGLNLYLKLRVVFVSSGTVAEKVSNYLTPARIVPIGEFVDVVEKIVVDASRYSRVSHSIILEEQPAPIDHQPLREQSRLLQSR